jgi:hypothetical protein
MIMKKLMTALAVCLAAGFAAAAGVMSSNIVGYVNVPLGATTAIVGISPAFKQVGGADQNILTMFDPSQLNEGDYLMEWNPAIGDLNLYTYIGGWFSPDSTLLDETNVGTKGPAMGSGSGFLIASASAKLTIAGEVNRTAQVTTTINPGDYTFLSAAYPVPFDLNAINWSGVSEGDYIMAWSDTIQDFALYTYIGGWFDPDSNLIPSGSPYYLVGVGQSIAYFSNAGTSWTITQTSPL